jgi:hypothetical protein
MNQGAVRRRVSFTNTGIL